MPITKVLFLTQDFPPEKGGIQTYALELAAHLQALGISVTVLCPGRPASARGEFPFPVRRIAIHSSWLFLPLLFRLPGLLRQGGFSHILHAQWQVGLWACLRPSLARRHRLACLVHGRELLTSIFGPLRPLLLRAVFRHMELALPNSRAVAALLRQRARLAAGVRVGLLHPGVHADAFRPLPPAETDPLRRRLKLEDCKVVFAMGRMVRRKNLHRLIALWPRLLAREPRARLVLGGGGPEAPALHRLVRELGLEGEVLFPGRIPDSELVLYFNLADIGVLLSRSDANDVEGFGIVLLEAAACGRPVIGASAGGIPDALEDGSTGLLVDPENGEEVMEAVLGLAANPQRAREMGERGRRRVLAGFTWEHCARNLVAHWNLVPRPAAEADRV